MRVEQGQDRIVLVGENLVIKVAKFKPIRFSKSAKVIIERYGVGRLKTDWSYSADSFGTLKSMLFHGVTANKREKRLSQSCGELVVPTISVLGGAINLQRTAMPTKLNEDQVEDSFTKHLGHKKVYLEHSIENPNNFRVSNGTVKFVDGGSRHLEDLAQTMQPEIQAALGSMAAKIS